MHSVNGADSAENRTLPKTCLAKNMRKKCILIGHSYMQCHAGQPIYSFAVRLEASVPCGDASLEAGGETWLSLLLWNRMTLRVSTSIGGNLLYSDLNMSVNLYIRRRGIGVTRGLEWQEGQLHVPVQLRPERCELGAC